jgi:polysaccharide biosynthesis protein PslJ
VNQTSLVPDIVAPELPPKYDSKHKRTDAVTLLSVYLLLLMAIPSAYTFGALGGAGSPANIFAAILLIWYLVTWLNPQRFVVNRSSCSIRFAGMFFVCVALAAYVSANRHNLSSLDQNGVDRDLIEIFAWLGVLLLAADGIDQFDRLQTMLRRIVLGATGMAIMGILQFTSGINFASYIIIPGLTQQVPFTDLISRNGLNRPSATAAHPLEFAAVLAISLPVAIHQARFSQPTRRLRRWLQVGLIAAAMPLTVSRTAILGLLTVAIVMLPVWTKRERRYAYAIIGASVAALFLLVSNLVSTITNLFLSIGSEPSSDSRISAFSYSVTLITQHPWLGIGFGAFDPVNSFYTDDQYLLQLIVTGVLGLVSLIGLFISGWSSARKVRARATDDETRHLGQALAASIAASAVAFATFDALTFSIAAGLTFLMLGCVAAAWKLSTEQLGMGKHVSASSTATGGKA